MSKKTELRFKLEKKLKEYDIYELPVKFKAQASADEQIELYDAVFSSPKGDIVEVGSASGGTTIVLIKAAEKVGKRVISIDPYPIDLEGNTDHYTMGMTTILKNEFKENILNGQYSNIIQYNSYTKDVVDMLPKDLSMVFIDGLHELSNVLEEIGLLYPLLVKGGKLYIHDTTWKIGQASRTREGGLNNIWKQIDRSLFSDIYQVDSMLCARK